MPELVIASIVAAAVLVLGMLFLIRRSWHTVASGQALIVLRMGSEPRVSFSGAMVMPIVNKAEVIDISAKQLVIARRGRDGLVCHDSIRADVVATFHLRINKTADDIVRVAQTVGAARAGDPRVLEEMFAAKFSEALKTVAATTDFDDLHQRRDVYKDAVIEVIGRDLAGFVLDDVAIDEIAQTPLAELDPENVLDAEGIRKIRQRTVGAELALQAARDKTVSLHDELARQGLGDVRMAVEISCDVGADRPALHALIEGPDDGLLAQLPRSLSPAVLAQVGTGTLACEGGRATFRWDLPHVTDTQLVAAARLVYALREGSSAFR